MVVDEGDQVLAITEERRRHPHAVSEEALQRRARDTMGVRLMALAEGDSVVGVARNPETDAERSTSRTPPTTSATRGQAQAVDGVKRGDAPEAPGAADLAATVDAGDAGPRQTHADGQDEEDA